MDLMQCPECGASEVPIEASSCPQCGYPILSLSGFTIRKRLLEGPEQNINQNEIKPAKGKQIKENLSRAKKALGKKNKQKSTIEEAIPVYEADKTLILPASAKTQVELPLEESPATIIREKIEPVIVPAEPVIIPEPEIEKVQEPAIQETADTVINQPVMIPAEPTSESQMETAEARVVEERKEEIIPATIIATEPQPVSELQHEKSEPMEVKPQKPKRHLVLSDIEDVDLPPPLESLMVPAEPITIPEPEAKLAQEPDIEEPADTVINIPQAIVAAEPAAVSELQQPEKSEPVEVKPQKPKRHIVLSDIEDVDLPPPLEPLMVPAEPVTIPEPEIELAQKPDIEETADTVINVPQPIVAAEPAAVSELQQPKKSRPIELKSQKPKRHIVLSDIEDVDLPPSLIAPDDHQYASPNYPKLGLPTNTETPDDVCYACGKNIDPNANFCPYCHASLLRRYCPGCRRLVAGNTSYCAYCGAPATSIAEPPRNFATLLAVLIIIFTGAAIFVARNLLFEQPRATMPVAKNNNKVSVPTKISQPSMSLPAKQTETPAPVTKAPALPPPEPVSPSTPVAHPKEDGLVETNLPEVEASKQPAASQPRAQPQAERRPPTVVEAPAESSRPTPTDPSTTELNSSTVSGIQTYKHRDPSLARYLNSVGFRLIQQRRYQEAVPILKRSVSYFPDKTKDIVYAYALFNLGHALRMSGRASEAIPVLEARLRIDNQRETVRKELAAARVAALGGQLQ